MEFEMTENLFSCKCREKKSHKLLFDGGLVGSYDLILCKNCYPSQNKKFLIKEEIL